MTAQKEAIQVALNAAKRDEETCLRPKRLLLLPAKTEQFVLDMGTEQQPIYLWGIIKTPTDSDLVGVFKLKPKPPKPEDEKQVLYRSHESADYFVLLTEGSGKTIYVEALRWCEEDKFDLTGHKRSYEDVVY